ncbi:MAG: DUF4258 domain-containing protein [Candidatus Hydrogenedentes bacterium]|nr:DUF4258 domain-containing protein [Candidatus Hydrogenedentota bacterium]
MTKYRKKVKPAVLSGPALMRRIRECVDADRLRFTDHALKEMEEDDITFSDAKRVAKTGWHNAVKDTLDMKRCSWKHAIDGKDADGRDLRLIIALDPSSGAVVVTAFRLNPRK